METIGIKMLRESLSEYIVRAREGERIIITDRGEEVAELVPLSPERRALMRLVAEGKARWNGQTPRLLPPVIEVAGSPFADAINEDRDAAVL